VGGFCPAQPGRQSCSPRLVMDKLDLSLSAAGLMQQRLEIPAAPRRLRFLGRLSKSPIRADAEFQQIPLHVTRLASQTSCPHSLTSGQGQPRSGPFRSLAHSDIENRLTRRARWCKPFQPRGACWFARATPGPPSDPIKMRTTAKKRRAQRSDESNSSANTRNECQSIGSQVTEASGWRWPKPLTQHTTEPIARKTCTSG